MRRPFSRFLAHFLQAVPLGLCGAILGFSWVWATTLERPVQPQGNAAVRSVGSSILQISNPALLTDPSFFDLGDACFGSAIARRVSALGGVTPYTFLPSDSSAENSGLAVAPFGLVTGTIPPGSTFSGRGGTFGVSVVDSQFNEQDGNFFLNTRAFPPGYFSFAMDSLPSAAVGMDYVTNIETINENSQTVFSVATGSVAFDGAPIPNLEFLGLTLFQDGTLAGRPLATGLLTFTARAVKNGAVALNRSSTAVDQPFAIPIGPAVSIQSVFATIGATIESGSGNSLTMQININPDGFKNVDFANNNFVLRFAGRTYQTVLDGQGKSRQGNLLVSLTAPSGQLRIVLKQDPLASIDPATLPDGSHAIFVAEVEIAGLYMGTEAIQFNVQNRNGRRRLTYRLGLDKQLGGLFQITRLQGQDSSAGSAFMANFIISHVKGETDIQFGNANFATVRIGPGFIQQMTLAGGVATFPVGSSGVRLLKIETNRKLGVLTTFPLQVSQTGAQFAHNSAAPTGTFLLGLDIGTNTVQSTFEGSRQIHPVTPFLP